MPQSWTQYPGPDSGDDGYTGLFQANRVTNPNFAEIVRNSLYDSLLYPTAGQTQLSFFSLPIGQGVTSSLGATVGTSKTLNDTNLVMANTLPSGLEVLVQSIEVLFLPGSVSTANTYTPANISLFNATAAASVAGSANDVNTFYQSGRLQFQILQKDYLMEAPLLKFPPKAMLDLQGAVASNSATTAEVALTLVKATGRPYFLDPAVTLLPSVNFAVNLLWPGAVATGSGFNGRVEVTLDGLFKRAGQ